MWVMSAMNIYTGKSHFKNFMDVINSFIISHGKAYPIFIQIHLLNMWLVHSKYHIIMMILLHPLNGIVYETCNMNLVRETWCTWFNYVQMKHLIMFSTKRL